MPRVRTEQSATGITLHGQGRVQMVEAELDTLRPSSIPIGEADSRVVRYLERGRPFPLPVVTGDYDPMTVRELPFELARLAPLRRRPTVATHLPGGSAGLPLLDQTGVVDGGAVQGFYRRRGALEYPGRDIIEANVADRREPGRRTIKETRWSLGGDPCWWVRQEAKEVWSLLELWQAKREGDVARLRELFGPVQRRVPLRPRSGGRGSSRGQQGWELDLWWELSPSEQASRREERRRHSQPQRGCRVCAPRGRLNAANPRPCIQHYWPEAECVVADVRWTGERPQLWVAAGRLPGDGRGASEVSTTGDLPGWETPVELPREVPAEYFGPLEDGDCLLLAGRFVRSRLGEHVRHLFEGLGVEEEAAGLLRAVLPISNLLDAVRFHLWRVITQGERVGRCRECGLLFPQRRRDNQFCSTKHRNTYWQRRHRHRKPSG